MSESTFTIINKNIASAGVPGQQQIDAVLATIDKRLKSIQDNIQPRNFLKKITRPIQNLGKNMFKGFFGGFTIGSLIKQSQVFTATAGSFFQIAGAMIDTILAPLAPALSKTITASATIGIKAARNVAKISGAVIGPILDQIPKIIEGIAYMVPKTLEFLFNVGKFIKDLISQGSITGVIIFAIRKLWEGLQYMQELKFIKLYYSLYGINLKRGGTEPCRVLLEEEKKNQLNMLNVLCKQLRILQTSQQLIIHIRE